MSYSRAAYAYRLVSFETIRNINVSEEEHEAGVVNFNEFLRIHIYNYLQGKPASETTHLENVINHLKYSARDDLPERKPPIILHWADTDKAMDIIKVLFREIKEMQEGIIGVDYVISEPLYHPDHPERGKRGYIVKLSRSEVATTWFHVPNKFKSSMGEQDRKYNKAINIEIAGWRFLLNPKSNINNFGKNGRLGIRETFNGDFTNFENNFMIYPNLLKFMNYMAEKYGFAELVDNFSPETEIDNDVKNKKGYLYLTGPLSKYIKGHGLVAVEHTLMFGGDYITARHDFVPAELLILEQDLKDFRAFNNFDPLTLNIENRLLKLEVLNNNEQDNYQQKISEVKNAGKREYLTYLLSLGNIKIETTDQFNEARKNLDFYKLKTKNKEIILSGLIRKFLEAKKSINADDYKYLGSIVSGISDINLKNNLDELIRHRYTNN